MAAILMEMVFPSHANHYGTLFGGIALQWMDKAAFIAASRHSRCTVVTARSESVDFDHPVRTGQLAECTARVVETRRTSMLVETELWAEDLLTGERRLCTRGSFVMVALDEEGRAKPVREVIAEPVSGARFSPVRDDLADGLEST